MSKKYSPPLKPAPAPDKNPREDVDDLPIIQSIGMAPAPGGKWVVVVLETQGERVVGKRIASDPDSKTNTVHNLKLEFMREIVIPNMRGGKN